MKKKKPLTPQEKAAKKKEQAADKEKLDKAIDSFAGDKTPEEWRRMFKHCAKARFTSGYILTRCQKILAFKAFKNNIPYAEIKPNPLFYERTLNRYFKEFIKDFLTRISVWTIVAILSDEMFFNLIFFEA